MTAIVSVRAAALSDPTALGRTAVLGADWQDSIDHMNPLASDARYAGQARRFEPPWDETICVVTADDGTWGMGMTALSGLTVPSACEISNEQRASARLVASLTPRKRPASGIQPAGLEALLSKRVF